METILSNAHIVTADEVVHGSIRVENGLITDIASGPCTAAKARDMEGDMILPGFVELHTDNLEKQLEPRPGVFWPDPLASVMAHDTQMTGAGITTVLDAVSLGQYHDGQSRTAIMDMSIRAIRSAREKRLLKADHRLHLRCEYPDPSVLDMFTPHVDDPFLLLVSLMDHTPGQRQYADPDQYRRYYANKGWTDEEFEQVKHDLIETQKAHAKNNRDRIIELCRERHISMAGHDDTTSDHIELAVKQKITISEFPTTFEAARSARVAGMSIVMGGPNVVRGKSHSGNVSALELAAENLLDILSSDYVPGSLAAGALTMHRTLAMPLPEAVAKISLNPARAVGLDDRGELAVGKRADMVRMRVVEQSPAILETWCAGGIRRGNTFVRDAA